MKKLALTSLLAVFAVSGAHAANVIDGNPLYMPKAGHAFSETSLASHTAPGRVWTLGEEYGYGVSDALAIGIGTSLSEKAAFDKYAWNDIKLHATYRALEAGAWKMDLMGGFIAGANPRFAGEMGPQGIYIHQDGNHWFDKDLTSYTWTAGVRGGYVGSSWTVAAHALFNYLNSESFNWGNKGTHYWNLGLDAQYVLCPHFNLVAGAEYTGVTNDHYGYAGESDPEDVKNQGIWTGMLGVNYNIDAAKYVGLYINGQANHQGGDEHNRWVAEKGFGIGAKFGIDF